MAATLLLSLGVPMISAGDEFCRTQEGNNNAYCQDTPISWLNWDQISEEDAEFREFMRYLIKLRKEHRVFRRKRYYTGKKIGDSSLKDITWITPEGLEMSSADWNKPYAQSLSALISGALSVAFCNEDGRFYPDNHFFIILNAFHDGIEWLLPEMDKDTVWNLILDTSRDKPVVENETYKPGDSFNVPAWSVLLFEAPLTDEEKAVLHSREGMTGILGRVYQNVQSSRLVATIKDLDNLDFMTYGPMGPVATLADMEKKKKKTASPVWYRNDIQWFWNIRKQLTRWPKRPVFCRNLKRTAGFTQHLLKQKRLC